MPAIVDDVDLKQRLRRVVEFSGNNNAAAGVQLGLSRHQVRQFVSQVGGFTSKKRAMLEEALERFEADNAARLASFDRRKAETGPDIKTLQNTSIPNIAHDVLKYMLGAVEAQRAEGRS